MKVKRISSTRTNNKYLMRTGLLISALCPLTVLATAGAPEETMVVTGVENSHADELFAHQTDSATKTSKPLAELSQSVSVITRSQMDEQNIRSLNEAIRYTPGVGAEQWGGVTAYDQYTIRGFSATENGTGDVFLDGLRNTNGLMFGVQQVDPFLLEQIDVLRGPVSVLYGLSNPGGIVSLTSKLPTADTIRHVEVEGGTYNYGRASLDLGGRLTDSGSVLYRMVATGHLADGMWKYSKNKGYALAPSVTFIPSSNDSLTLYSRFQYDPYLGAITSIPIAGTVFHNPNGKLPLSAWPGEPDSNTFSRKQSAVGYNYQHIFNDDWSVILKGKYFGETSSIKAVQMVGVLDDMRTILRQNQNSDEHFNTLNFDNQLHGRFDTGDINHNVLLGFNVDNLRGNSAYFGGSASNLDIYNPDYGHGDYGPLYPYVINRVNSTQNGIYFQDELEWNQWRTTLGIRHDWNRIVNENKISNKNYTQNDSVTTGRVGLNYIFDNGLSPYFTWSQSFQPVTGLSKNQKPFKPSYGELYEAGLKYQPAGSSTLLSAAIFNLTQTNSLTTDPLNPNFKVQNGKIRSRGLELESHAALTEQFSLIGSYTLQDVKYIKDNDGWKGKTPIMIPRSYGGLWVDWEAPDNSVVNGLGIALGGRFSGGTKGGNAKEEFDTGGYGVMDASVRYDLGKLTPSLKGGKVQLTAQNLLDRRYVAGCYSEEYGCFWGAGQQIIGKVMWNF
ncbi:TonB-dependent siderophore receptor [Salmonella enterica]|nr:TonB-dependent siderophore receptor [Salmonella enterica]EBL8184387.1 TonB-dependent siderophore receptor [Salmonella enterica]EJG3781447.1 TonB-dependent siderophore receptor [Salmonella enterica]EJM0404666.1 TonB-dependent siderophore receptor [Salmonella enterica]EKH2727560.1 TonB-dependent siderophore receptor [Salmonella enterica]